jgi:hypothetical protein
VLALRGCPPIFIFHFLFARIDPAAEWAPDHRRLVDFTGDAAASKITKNNFDGEPAATGIDHQIM